MNLKNLDISKFLVKLLRVEIYILVVAIGIDLYDIYYWQAAQSISEELVLSDTLNGIMGLIQVVIAVILGVTFLKWIYRINHNLHIVSGTKLKFTPGWSIGWYFIPIANLFKPYQAMKEIFSVSHKDEKVDTSLLNKWWALWLITGYIGQVAVRLSLKADDPSGYLASSVAYLLSDGADIVLNLVAIKLVLTIMGAYETHFKNSSLVVNPTHVS